MTYPILGKSSGHTTYQETREINTETVGKFLGIHRTSLYHYNGATEALMEDKTFKTKFNLVVANCSCIGEEALASIEDMLRNIEKDKKLLLARKQEIISARYA